MSQMTDDNMLRHPDAFWDWDHVRVERGRQPQSSKRKAQSIFEGFHFRSQSCPGRHGACLWGRLLVALAQVLGFVIPCQTFVCGSQMGVGGGAEKSTMAKSRPRWRRPTSSIRNFKRGSKVERSSLSPAGTACHRTLFRPKLPRIPFQRAEIWANPAEMP